MTGVQTCALPIYVDLDLWSKKFGKTPGIEINYGFANKNGYLWKKAGYTGSSVFIGDRDHFRALVDASNDTFYIGVPVYERTTGRQVIPTARRLVDRQGVFQGVVVGIINTDLIGSFYSTARLGDGGSLLLKRTDQTILAIQGPTSRKL